MPKSKATIPGTKKQVSKRTKFKLRGRKSSVGALEMNSDDLLKVFMDKDAGKGRHKASQVLTQRGLNVAALVAAEQAKAAESEAA